MGFNQIVCLALLSLNLISCGHSPVLKPDRSVSPTISNYNSAQFSACNTIYSGMGFCSVTANEEVDLKIYLQGFNGGRFALSGCGIEQGDMPIPQNQEELIIPLFAFFGDCVATFTLSPKLVFQDHSSAIIGSLRGQLYLAHRRPLKRMFQASKLKEGPPSVSFPVPTLTDQASVHVFSTGPSPHCRVDFTKHYLSDHHRIEIPLSDLYSVLPKGTCFMQGLSEEKNQPKTFLSWVTHSYASDFIPLRVPEMEWKTEELLCVKTQEDVTLLYINHQYSVSDHGCFKVHSNEAQIFRALTTSIRSVMGFWNPIEKLWRWYE